MRGVFSHGPRLPPHAKEGRGARRAACVPVPIVAVPAIAPVRAPVLVHARMGVPRPLHPTRMGRGAKGGHGGGSCGPPPRPPSVQTGVGEGGIPLPSPLFVCSARVRNGTQGAGVMPRAGFLCPVEVQAMPPACKTGAGRGWSGGTRARCFVR